MFSQWSRGFYKREYDKLPVHSFSGHGTSGVNYNNNNYSGVCGHDRVSTIESTGWINTSQYYDSRSDMILRSRTTGRQLPLGQHPMRNMLKANPMLYGNSSDHVQSCYISPLPSPGLNEVVSTYESKRPEVFFTLPNTAGKLGVKKGSCGQRFLKSFAAKILLFMVLCAIMTTCFYSIIDAFRKQDTTHTPDENESNIKVVYSKNDDDETVLEAVTS